MAVLGVLARFAARPSTDTEIRRFFADGPQIVEQRPSSTTWFAFPTVRSQTFASEDDRADLLAAGGPNRL